MNKNHALTVQQDSVVANLMRASTALAEAKTIQQTKKIIDVAAAAEIYAKRQQLGEEAVGLALSIKVEALRKLGEILKETPKSKSRFHEGNKKEPSSNEALTLAELGLNKKTSAVAQKLAGLSDSAFEQVREGNETIAHAIAAVSENKQHKPSLAVVQPLSEPEPKEPEEPEYTELDAAHDTIDFLRAELAVKNAEGSEEDKQQAKNLIESLMAENKTLRASEAAIKKSRDSFQSQVAELKHQIQRQRREIDKLTGGQKTA